MTSRPDSSPATSEQTEAAVVGGAVRYVREEHGLSQDQLASAISRWLGGRSRTDPAARKRWKVYRLKRPAFSSSLVRKIEKTGRASDRFLRILVDYFAEVHGVGGDRLRTAAAVEAVPAAAPPWPVPRQLPEPPPDFTGRAVERETLAAGLTGSSRGGGGGAVVFGLGGCGKTALALAVAAELSERYPDGQVYLDLRGDGAADPVAPAAALRHVLLSLDPSRRLPDDEMQLVGLYRSVLRPKRLLLLFDNALDERQVEPLLPPSTCTVLVTSRRRFTLPGLFVMSLAEMAPADAVRFYREAAGGRAQRAADVARLCGYLPLAVRLAASELRLELSSEAALVERLSDDAERAHLAERVIDHSYARLPPDAQACLRALTVLPATFDVRAAAAVWGADDASGALRELQQASLVEGDRRIGRYRLHDLVRVAVGRRLAAAERAADELRFATYFLRLWRDLEDRHHRTALPTREALAAFDRERASLDAAFAWARERADHEPHAAALCAESVGPAAALLQLRRAPGWHRDWFLVALRAARQVRAREAEIHSLGWLGEAWSLLGHDRKAVACQQRRLSLASGRRRLVRDALEGLARAYGYGCDYGTAAKLFEECLALAGEEGDRASQARIAYSLAQCFEHLAPDRARALALYGQARAHARAAGRACIEGQAECGIGVHRVRAGAYDDARAHFERGLEIAHRFHDRTLELYALGCMASLRARRGDHAGALQLLGQVESLARELGNTIQLSATWRYQAASLEALGRRPQAADRVRAIIRLGERAPREELSLAREMLARLGARG